ncbi:unnamed protein product, partial [Protopolystoma xenopodis]
MLRERYESPTATRPRFRVPAPAGGGPDQTAATHWPMGRRPIRGRLPLLASPGLARLDQSPSDWPVERAADVLEA